MVAELLREAAAALEEQRDAGSETATDMPAPNRTGEGHANRCLISTSDRSMVLKGNYAT